MENSIIRFDSVTVTYGAIQALQDVSLDVEAGQHLSRLSGANGAGKRPPCSTR